jgi:hypothetical protein
MMDYNESPDGSRYWLHLNPDCATYTVPEEQRETGLNAETTPINELEAVFTQESSIQPTSQ